MLDSAYFVSSSSSWKGSPAGPKVGRFLGNRNTTKPPKPPTANRSSPKGAIALTPSPKSRRSSSVKSNVQNLSMPSMPPETSTFRPKKLAKRKASTLPTWARGCEALTSPVLKFQIARCPSSDPPATILSPFWHLGNLCQWCYNESEHWKKRPPPC